jgi:hypothetical protein
MKSRTDRCISPFLYNKVKSKGRVLTLTLDVAVEKKRKDVTVQCVKDCSFLDVDPSKENSNAFESLAS